MRGATEDGIINYVQTRRPGSTRKDILHVLSRRNMVRMVSRQGPDEKANASASPTFDHTYPSP